MPDHSFNINYNVDKSPSVIQYDISKMKPLHFDGKLSGTPKKDNLNRSVNINLQDTVDLSKEALLRAKSLEEQKKNEKKSGVTSAREIWEDDAMKIKHSDRYDCFGNDNIMYIFRMDEPETYAKCQSTYAKKNECIITKEENGLIQYDFESQKDLSIKYSLEAAHIFKDWYDRRILTQGESGPVSGQKNIIERLEDKYSKGLHDFSINFYGIEGEDEIQGRKNQFAKESLWRYSTKFNMLLSADMLKQLADNNNDDKDNFLKRIDKAVSDMKEAERQYSGTKVALRFGVKFHEDGSTTYHANYLDCEDSYGIQANSSEELLEMLMSDK